MPRKEWRPKCISTLPENAESLPVVSHFLLVLLLSDSLQEKISNSSYTNHMFQRQPTDILFMDLQV